MRCLGVVLSLVLSVAAFADEERVPPGEAAATARVLELIEKTVIDAAKADGYPARRDAHAKHHGCVKAEVRVLGGLPEKLAVGVFAAPKTYPAWIRFSNGSQKSQDDSVGDGRGMAIKLMSVPGRKILAEESDAKTQDFIMINHPTFFVRNAADYVVMQEAMIKGRPMDFFFPSVDPRTWRVREAKIAKTMQMKKPANPLELQYWSMTPYRLGTSEVKYSARPCSKTPMGSERTSSPNFLRENMARALSKLDVCFELMMQLRGDHGRMPVEDPTVEWSERESPMQTVAVVRIFKQNFMTKERMEFCENLSFTPLHSLAEHRPIGGINRVRNVVYTAISKLRHHLNKAPRLEPTVETTKGI